MLDIRNKTGKLISEDELLDVVRERVSDALDWMDEDDALCLGNDYRENHDESPMYKLCEREVNEIMDDCSPWDLLNMEYRPWDGEYFTWDEYDFNTYSDIFEDIDKDDLIDEIIGGEYSSEISSDIQDILDEYEETKEYLDNMSEWRLKCMDAVTAYMRCEAEVSDLLILLEQLGRNEDIWKDN